MQVLPLCNHTVTTSSPLFSNTLPKKITSTFPSNFKPSIPPSSSSPSSFRLNCTSYSRESDSSNDETRTPSWAHSVLGLDPPFSPAQLKAAFRAKVKQFHPDLAKDRQNSELMIRRVIQAYEILSDYSKSEIIESECTDPFDQPECEALDLFVNEILCAGRRCSCSCVDMAPHAFEFSSATGTARLRSQGHGEDYRVQIAVGQCPRRCIHYVTPLQRVVLKELLRGIIGMPHDTSAEAELLYALVVKAKYENNRYQKPRN